MIERASSRSSIFFVQRTTTRAKLHQSVARSCGSPVFVDHTAEQITTRHPYRELGPRDWPRPIWWDQPKRAMWPMLVVVRHIDTKDALQVTAADDQEVVETRKSQVNVVAACWRKKTRDDKPLRSGAGGTLAPIRTLRTVVAEIATPRPLSSPTILRYPPARVLPREANDQRDNGRVERRR